MKIEKIDMNISKEFKPLTIQITIETLDECRVLFHMFNHCKIHEQINNKWYGYSPMEYEEVSPLPMSENYRIFQEHITNQGFKV